MYALHHFHHHHLLLLQYHLIISYAIFVMLTACLSSIIALAKTQEQKGYIDTFRAILRQRMLVQYAANHKYHSQPFISSSLIVLLMHVLF